MIPVGFQEMKEETHTARISDGKFFALLKGGPSTDDCLNNGVSHVKPVRREPVSKPFDHSLECHSPPIASLDILPWLRKVVQVRPMNTVHTERLVHGRNCGKEGSERLNVTVCLDRNGLRYRDNSLKHSPTKCQTGGCGGIKSEY